MDKKLQMPRSITKDVHICSTKTRKKEFINERSFPTRSNSKNPHGSCNYAQRSSHKQNSKHQMFLPDSVSLSNEEFIVANAQIWVHQNAESYENIHNNWDDIIQITFYTNDDLNCPICMGPPLVSRTDRCGHVYCLPCLNKFLSYKSDFGDKCALCNQHIVRHRVKRAGIMPLCQFNAGDTISMVLMKRSKNESYPVPIDTFATSMPHLNTFESRFSSVAVCSNDDLLSIIRMEIMTLEDELTEALHEANDRITSISDALETVRSEFEKTSLLQSKKSIKTSLSNTVTFDDVMLAIAAGSVYYQSENGCNIFMCPLNWKCMSYEFLDSNHCLPLRLNATIIDVEKFVVTPEFQNRYRYLRYLPPGSSVSFVELDLADIVSQKTLDKFETAIQVKTDGRLQKERIDELLTSEKIMHENSFNKSREFKHLGSLMKKHEDFFNDDTLNDDDFAPLNANASYSEKASGSENCWEKRTFADMIQKKPSLVSRVIGMSLDQVNEYDTPNRGISLSDCVVVKSTRKKRR